MVQSFDRTVSMKPCCSLTIRKFFVLTLSFQARLFIVLLLENVAFACNDEKSAPISPDSLGLYGQVNKRIWWMPWR